MYRKLKTVSSYVSNQSTNCNYSLDGIQTLQSILLTPALKQNTRLLFKIDDSISDEGLATLLTSENVKFIYRFAISDILIGESKMLEPDMVFELQYLTKSWESGMGSYDNENYTGVTWDSFSTGSDWSVEGGDYVAPESGTTMINYNFADSTNDYFDVDITSQVKEYYTSNGNKTAKLFDNGFEYFFERVSLL